MIRGKKKTNEVENPIKAIKNKVKQHKVAKDQKRWRSGKNVDTPMAWDVSANNEQPETKQKHDRDATLKFHDRLSKSRLNPYKKVTKENDDYDGAGGHGEGGLKENDGYDEHKRKALHGITQQSKQQKKVKIGKKKPDYSKTMAQHNSNKLKSRYDETVDEAMTKKRSANPTKKKSIHGKGELGSGIRAMERMNKGKEFDKTHTKNGYSKKNAKRAREEMASIGDPRYATIKEDRDDLERAVLNNDVKEKKQYERAHPDRAAAERRVLALQNKRKIASDSQEVRRYNSVNLAKNKSTNESQGEVKDRPKLPGETQGQYMDRLTAGNKRLKAQQQKKMSLAGKKIQGSTYPDWSDGAHQTNEALSSKRPVRKNKPKNNWFDNDIAKTSRNKKLNTQQKEPPESTHRDQTMVKKNGWETRWRTKRNPY